MAPKPKSPPKSKAPDAAPEAKPSGIIMDLVEPFQALTDLITGAVFDGPKAAAPVAAESVTDDETDPSPKPQTVPSTVNVNFDLGKYFKPAKLKRDPVAGTEKTGGKASGEQDPPEGE